MYLKSTHSRLLDGGHQWEVTLFCNTEANTIASVDINPKSRGSKVTPNDARPAPTAYTLTYTIGRNEYGPDNFSASILLKNHERKTVSVPANMATDRKRRRADGSVDDEVEEAVPTLPPPPEEDVVVELGGNKCLFCWGRKKTKRNNKKRGEINEKAGESDDVVTKGCCCACTIQ